MEDDVVARRYHRRMYVDLVRAYLLDYGSRRMLARALGVKEPFVTYILAPEGVCNARGTPRPLKTPSRVKAEQLVALLCPDADRRAVLLRHITAARADGSPAAWWGERVAVGLTVAPLDDVLRALERLHAAAAFGASQVRARTAYAALWRQGQVTAHQIDPRLQPLPYAQVLLYVHEVACVFDRADLALAYARQAQLALDQAAPGPAQRDAREWLALGAARAEVVALNNLGLAPTARQAALHIEQTLLNDALRPAWLPHLYRDRLTSLRKMRRFAVSEAEILYERAAALVEDIESRLLLEERLAGALLAHGTPRSLRKARPLVERGLRYAEPGSRPSCRTRDDPDEGRRTNDESDSSFVPSPSLRSGSGQALRPSSGEECYVPHAQGGKLRLGTLHRAQLLRTAALYAWKVGDEAMWALYLQPCLRLVTAAGLTHQRRQLERQYGASVIEQLTHA